MCGIVGYIGQVSWLLLPRRQTSQGDSRFCDRSTADPQCFGTSSQRRSPVDTCVLCGSR